MAFVIYLLIQLELKGVSLLYEKQLLAHPKDLLFRKILIFEKFCEHCRQKKELSKVYFRLKINVDFLFF